MDAFFLTPDDARRVRDTVRAHEHRPKHQANKSRRRRQPERPLIVGVLLEDLRTGEEAEVAVLRRERNNHVQIVTIVGFHHDDLGGVTDDEQPGSFRLRFSPTDSNQPGQYQESGSIPWNATAEQLKAALLQMSYFRSDDLSVQLGEHWQGHIGRWTVHFGGDWADQDVPLMRAIEDSDDHLGGQQQAQVTGTSYLEDTGRTETIFGVLPSGLPGGLGHSPLRRGAYCVCGFVPEVGYVALAVEMRDYYPDPTDPTFY